VPECFKDDNASQWWSGKFDPRSLRNPWTDQYDVYICMDDYVGDPYPCAKFHHDTITSFRPPPNMRKCASSDSASFLVLSSAYSQDPCTDFHDQYVKWRRFAQGCTFWGSWKQNFTFRPHFPSKTQICRQFSTGQKISHQKGLNNGDAHLQTTPNRHRSPMKVV